MGARSPITRVGQPWPVVFDAFLQCLPPAGFRIESVDAERGRIALSTRNTSVLLAVGAVDAITSEWMATAELKLGVFRDRHAEKFRAIDDALSLYLATYYP